MFKHLQKIYNFHLTGEIAAYLYFRAESVVEYIISKDLAWKNVYVHHVSACVSACQVNTVGGVLKNDLPPHCLPVFGSSHRFSFSVYCNLLENHGQTLQLCDDSDIGYQR